ncbi:hypothetical protein [Streptomyces rimosus]|uniref:hypothetical protein n=1 Tax=Streptomyces rimosus TaxID=1927 RepID=UPI000A8FB340|nr:hypothetical protein [Streptomyces rimosus]
MSTPTRQVRALMAHVPAAPHGALPQRRAGATEALLVPVAGMELCPEETAAALFEVYSDEYGVPDMTTETLYDLLGAALFELGPAGLLEVTKAFSELESAEFPEVGACRRYAYRLAVASWYEGARARPMTVGEAAVALYLSDAYRHHQIDTPTARRAPLLVSRAIRQSAALVPIETLTRLGDAMVQEFAAPAPTSVTPGVTAASGPGVTGGGWLYRQALPDWHRRRWCFDLMRADTRQPSPLVVRLDGGAYAVGATPPAGPDGTWARTLRAGW